jgi:hypothetical protein
MVTVTFWEFAHATQAKAFAHYLANSGFYWCYTVLIDIKRHGCAVRLFGGRRKGKKW